MLPACVLVQRVQPTASDVWLNKQSNQYERPSFLRQGDERYDTCGKETLTNGLAPYLCYTWHIFYDGPLLHVHRTLRISSYHA